jgi:hypothetical protein
MGFSAMPRLKKFTMVATLFVGMACVCTATNSATRFLGVHAECCAELGDQRLRVMDPSGAIGARL